MIPTRDTLPAAREALIQNIDNIIKAKLGLSSPQSPQSGQGTTYKHASGATVEIIN